MMSFATLRTGRRHLRRRLPIVAAAMLATAPAGSTSAADTSLRVATFNVAMSPSGENDLIDLLSDGSWNKAKAVAEVIQRVDPDVLLLNEFNYDAGGVAIRRFQNNYLAVSQNLFNLGSPQTPVTYDHVYFETVNTGLQPETIDPAWDFDINDDGGTDGPDDAFGFGNYAGQFGMVVLSKHPIATADVRTFQRFRWADMPGHLIPPGHYAEPGEQNALRLSSKSHWDVPIEVGGQVIHLLASHPTPPAFDGPEDRNGRRNHDEIRLLADYITPGAGDYVVDDVGVTGGIAPGAHFVIAGDLNADPDEGDSFNNAIDQLLDSPWINTSFTPTGSGPNADDTAAFSSLQLRVDYVLPSSGLMIDGGGVFWPANFGDPGQVASTLASDHRLVYLDVTVPEPASTGVMACTLVAIVVRRRVRSPAGTRSRTSCLPWCPARARRCLWPSRSMPQPHSTASFFCPGCSRSATPSRYR